MSKFYYFIFVNLRQCLHDMQMLGHSITNQFIGTIIWNSFHENQQILQYFICYKETFQ